MKRYFLLLFAALLAVAVSCKKDQVTVTTNDVTELTQTSVRLQGNFIDPTSTVGLYGFFITGKFSGETQTRQLPLPTKGKFSYLVENLESGEAYRYQAYVIFRGKEIRGEEKQFFTYSEAGWALRAQAVDFGTGVKWATKNVGATTAEDFGDYFAWGHALPSSDYSEAAYAGHYMTEITPESDPATTCLGGHWRMPTRKEAEALIDACETARWKAQNSVSGIELKGKDDYASSSIFLPAAGTRYPNSLGGLMGTNLDCRYWTSTLNSQTDNNAWYIHYTWNTSNRAMMQLAKRYWGLPVRAVLDE